jgi:LacI family transcriptional regulator
MRQWNADGIIALQSRLREVKSLRLPTVVAIESRRLPRAQCQLVCDNQGMGQMGSKALLAQGFRQFAYCGLERLEFSEVRGSSFVYALEQAGFPARVYSAPHRNLANSWYTEERHLSRWLLDLPKPIGLMACNDDRARMLSEICHLRGIRVPEDIAILGVDNDEQVCKSATPPLSSIAIATERAGYEAAAALARMMSGRDHSVQQVTAHPTHVVSRQSTDVLAIEDPTMMRALRFIRQNGNRPVRVQDVAAEAGLSRRALQDRFSETLGRTPRQEIHRCRVDRLAHLLVETNMTIGQIAAATGFEIDAHVARFFSRHTGMTPLAYRRKHLAS